MKVNLYEKLIELSKSDVSIVIFKNGHQESVRLVEVPEIKKIIDLGLRIEESNTDLAKAVKKQLEINTTLANAIDLLNERLLQLEINTKGEIKSC